MDGYNLPLGLVYVAGGNTSFIPPNLTNAACVATAGWLNDTGAGSSSSTAPTGTASPYAYSTNPLPYARDQTHAAVSRWCPWDLQSFPPSKPGDGVYPYPDDDIARPSFDPCLSACAAWGQPSDCCTGDYSTPDHCSPSLYSQRAKAVCPDAYSYAFDDQTSTFILPSGGGWEVVFCPRDGRSTDILRTFGPQLRSLASTGALSTQDLDDLRSLAYIQTYLTSAAPVPPGRQPPASIGRLLLLGLALWGLVGLW